MRLIYDAGSLSRFTHGVTDVKALDSKRLEVGAIINAKQGCELSGAAPLRPFLHRTLGDGQPTVGNRLFEPPSPLLMRLPQPLYRLPGALLQP